LYFSKIRLLHVYFFISNKTYISDKPLDYFTPTNTNNMTSSQPIISKIPPVLSIVETSSILTDRFYFRSKNFFKIVLIADILHIEAKKSYLDLHTTSGIYRSLPLKLKSFSDQMNHPLLLRVHRSHIINVLHIDSFTKNTVHLHANEDTIKISIGATYQEDVFSFLVSNMKRLMMD